MSETSIVEKCSEIRDTFLNKYERTRAAYAGKAFLTVAMCKIIDREGLCIDVVSGGELYTAIKSNFPAWKIEFNGNNKSIDELELAIDYNIGRIIVDGLDELKLIEEICKENPSKQVIISTSLCATLHFIHLSISCRMGWFLLFGTFWILFDKKWLYGRAATSIEIFDADRNRIASHPRRRSGKRYVSDPAHMPQHHRAQWDSNQWNGTRYRQWARQIGVETFGVVDRMLAAHSIEEQAYKSCMGLLQLAKKYSPERLENACGRAITLRRKITPPSPTSWKMDRIYSWHR